MKVLITGGAGFIGARLAKKIARQGETVTIVDSLSEQIHGSNPQFPDDLKEIATCIKGSILDRKLMEHALLGQDAIVHLAAETGTGQSMYDIERYSNVNLHGTALIFDILVNAKNRTVKKFITASSRAIYGEGEYFCEQHGRIFPPPRTGADMSAGNFEALCPICKKNALVVATREDTPFSPASFYGLTKQVQEQMTLMFAQTLGISGIALRYQNVYGPGQSLNNPYTGILAVFSNLARKNADINIFEDGKESRDFVYVDDIVDATSACINENVQGIVAMNVGSGVRTDVTTVAREVVAHFNSKSNIKISGQFRIGDIRHSQADMTEFIKRTGFAPRWGFKDGLDQFLNWAKEQPLPDSAYGNSLQELESRGLLGTS